MKKRPAHTRTVKPVIKDTTGQTAQQLLWVFVVFIVAVLVLVLFKMV